MKVDDIRIRNVCARCPESVEPLHARLRLSHLLGTADFRPSGLPPQAILLLRRLRAPRPLSLDSLRVPVDWEQTLRGEVDRLLQSAVRPVNGWIPAGAEAVLFTEYAELLACLGLLVLQPDTDSIWVWQSVVGVPGSFPATDVLVRVWRESTRDLPAALFHLDSWDVSVPVLQALSESDITSLIVSVAIEAGLPIPPATFSPETGEQIATEDTSETRSALPDWWRERPASERTLSPAVQSLLNLARTIVTTSSLTQRCAVLAAIQAEQQWDAQRSYRDSATPPATTVIPSAETRDEDVFPSHQATEQASAREFTPEIVRADVLPFQAKAKDNLERVNSPELQKADSSFVREAKRISAEGIEESDTGVTQREEDALWNGLTGTPTQFGGVFYLLNLFLRCDAPACFDAEFGLTDHITLWGLLQGFAEALLDAALTPYPSPKDSRSSLGRGETSSEIVSRTKADVANKPDNHLLSPTEGNPDPLWELLARLDGREPEESIAPRLPNRDDALSAIYARLSSELNTLLQEEPVTELLLRPAVIYTTRTHVDVVMALDAIWLPARRAGLDASPGWIPDLMRVVLFHFV